MKEYYLKGQTVKQWLLILAAVICTYSFLLAYMVYSNMFGNDMTSLFVVVLLLLFLLTIVSFWTWRYLQLYLQLVRVDQPFLRISDNELQIYNIHTCSFLHISWDNVEEISIQYTKGGHSYVVKLKDFKAFVANEPNFIKRLIMRINGFSSHSVAVIPPRLIDAQESEILSSLNHRVEVEE